MSTYKVIQDIEAEDKLLGPLSLRQFIYAIIVIVCGFIAFKLGVVNPLLAVPFIPVMIFFGALAAPLGGDQPTEIWLLAKIRYYLKPRRRVWDQSGASEMVTITAPKVVEKHLTKELTQTEVRSRLQALANTIDSRGWAVKNVEVNLFTQPSYIANQTSDRLIDPNNIPQEVPSFQVTAADDMMDERNNPTAQKLDQMIQVSAQQRHQQLLDEMRQGTIAEKAPQPAATPTTQAAPDYWFMNENSGATQGSTKPGYTTFSHNPLVAPGTIGGASAGGALIGDAEKALLEKLHREQSQPLQARTHLKVVEPLSQQRNTPPAIPATPMPQPQLVTNTSPATPTTVAAAPNSTGTTPGKPVVNRATLELAVNDDLNVATIARQANKAAQGPSDEVVVNLH